MIAIGWQTPKKSEILLYLISTIIPSAQRAAYQITSRILQLVALATIRVVNIGGPSRCPTMGRSVVVVVFAARCRTGTQKADIR